MKTINKKKILFHKEGVKKWLLTMKITTLLCFLAVFKISATVYSQNTTFDLDIQEKTVKEILDVIEEQSKFRFFYNDKFIDLNKKITFKSKKSVVTDILLNLFEESDVTFKVLENNLIVITPKDNANLQEITIKGKVVDTDGKPLPGVNIVEKGTTNGSVSNLEGEYSISLANENAVLVFSYIGYLTEEIEIAGKSSIDLTMVEDIMALDEVVVVGYGTLTRKEVTGSIATVSSEELTLAPTANASELLSGKVAGILTRQKSSLPGSDATEIQIRNFGEPLVLVDGIEMGFSRIDQNDIESITILKDASAAIYGARAGNGVILVTTKRGGGEAPSISYHGSYTSQYTTNFPDWVNAGDFASMLREAELNDGIEPTYSEEEVQKYINQEFGYGSYDWRDATIKNGAPMQQHNLSITGGNERVKYFASLGYTDQESVFRSRDFDYTRYNGRSNIDIKVSDRIDFSIDLAFRKELTDGTNASMSAIWDAIGTAEPVLPTWGPDKTKLLYSGFQTRNPIGATMKEFRGFNEDHKTTFTGRTKLSYKIPGVKGLKATAGLNVVGDNRFRKTFATPSASWNYDVLNDLYTLNAAAGDNIQLTEKYDRSSQIFPFAELTYQGLFGEHSIKGLLHAEYIEEYENNFWAERNNILAKSIPYLFAGGETNIDNNGRASEGARSSIIGRVNYNYQDKYYLTGAFRYDANVQFAPDHRWGFFPSLELAWRMSEEEFFKGITNVVNGFKLRASYSETGNDRFAEGWDYLTGFGVVASSDNYKTHGYIFGETNGQEIATIGLSNPNLTWEEMTNYNVGFDAALLNNKLLVEADAFYRKREGILALELSSLPSIFGANLPKTNLNSEDTRGIEGMITYQENIGDIRFSIAPNFTWARAKWIHYEEEEYTDEDDIRILKESGSWVSRNIGYLTDGIFMTQEEIDNHPIDQDQNGNTTLRPGDIKYIDLNGDGVITSRDRDVIGKGDFPTISYGMNLNVGYKNFSLAAVFQGASGFDRMIASTKTRGAFSNESTPLTYQRDYRWQPDPNNPGVNINPDAKLPALSTGGVLPNNDKDSDFWLLDGSYLRLKNLQLAYTLPGNVLKSTGVKMLNIYVSATNVLTLSKLGIYKHVFDPEQSFTNGVYPLHRNYTIGVRVTL